MKLENIVRETPNLLDRGVDMVMVWCWPPPKEKRNFKIIYSHFLKFWVIDFEFLDWMGP